MQHVSRRDKLAARLPELDADAFLVTRLVNVRYLSGFTGSNGQLLLGPERAVLFTDPRYDGQSAREAVGLERRVYSGELTRALGEACSELGARRLAFEARGVTYDRYRRLGEMEGLDLQPTDDEVERLRWIKDDAEVRLLEEAQSLTDDAFETIVGKLAPGMTEREVAFELEVTMRRAGAEALAFDTIVAFGEQAAEPHHRPGDRALAPGDLVKLDFGCVVGGYHSDMTRTVAFGEPDPRLREIYGVVLRAQLAGIEAVRAGTTGGEVDAAARRVVEEAGHGDAFTHSLGHGVGLEVHEGPTLRKGSEEVLPAGAVVTVEPGVYLPGLGGIRIEDSVLVTEAGSRPLPHAPKELIVL